MRSIALVCSIAAAGCTSDYQTFVVGGTATSVGSTGSSESATASASATVGSGGGGATAGSTGGAGGLAPACGDGVLGADEECDDANRNADDGCDGCKVVCDPPDTLEPTTKHCYHVVPGSSTVTVSSAGSGPSRGDYYGALLQHCLDWRPNAYPAALTSQAENDFAYGLVSGDTIIGAIDPFFDQSDKDKWAWGDGEVWDYDNWAGGQPDWPQEDCAAFWGGNQWHNVHCFDQRDLLCEWSPPAG